MGRRPENQPAACPTVHDVVPSAVELDAQRSHQFRSIHRTRCVESHEEQGSMSLYPEAASLVLSSAIDAVLKRKPEVPCQDLTPSLTFSPQGLVETYPDLGPLVEVERETLF